MPTYTLTVLLVIACITGVRTFHLVKDPQQILRVCSPQFDNYCLHRYGNGCRGHQARDASPLTPVCDGPPFPLRGTNRGTSYYGLRWLLWRLRQIPLGPVPRLAGTW